MYETGAKLREARQAAGISLAGMARLVNFSKSYLGLVETGRRAATGDVVRAYEKAIGEDLNRRALLLGAASAAVAPRCRTLPWT